jgi:hypothetical protein
LSQGFCQAFYEGILHCLPGCKYWITVLDFATVREVLGVERPEPSASKIHRSSLKKKTKLLKKEWA